MRDVITSAKHKGYEIQILYGQNIHDPRKEKPCLGKMLCYHPNYDLLGDNEYRDENYPKPGPVLSMILSTSNGDNASDTVGYLPLYLHDHSGLSMHWDPKYFNNRFDTSHVGFYFFTRKDLENFSEEFKNRDIDYLKEEGLKIAKEEILEYSKYISNSVTVVDYIIEDPEGSVIDSCAGYILGDEGLTKETISMIIDDMYLGETDMDMVSFKEIISKKLLENI